ncbi:MAG: hypothetical protein Hens2KO_22920 [Henriciella sp.]
MLRIFALFVLLTSLCATAAAGTVQNVRFAQTGKVLVWMDGEMIGQGAKVSLNNGNAVAKPFFGNGTLEPSQASSADVRHRLIVKIASNTGFTLETDTPREQGEISVRVVEQGQNAQVLTRHPARGSLSIFEQSDRTARRPGTAETQALTLEVISTGRALDDLTIKATES